MSEVFSQYLPPPELLLVRTIQKSGKVKETIEACARDLSTANQALRQKLAAYHGPDGVGEALSFTEAIEERIRYCAEELRILSTALAAEISARADLEERLKNSELLGDKHRFLAFHDVITGLANRALFNDRLDRALAQGQRHGRPFVVLFIDIDNFKQVNDTCGHDVGDKVLHLVAQRLQACVRDEDTVSRAGGDEFLCLVMEVNQDAIIANIAQAMIDQVSRTDSAASLKTMVKLSIGIAMCPRDGVTAEKLLKNADTAMYKAKVDGSGYCFASSRAAADGYHWENPGKAHEDAGVAAAQRMRLP